MGSIMLALSTFRQSEKAIELAIEKAKGGKNLIVVFVADVNLARYLIGTDVALYPELKEKCEEEILKEHRDRAEKKVSLMAKTAEDHGVSVKTYVSIGRFALECLKVVEEENPELIITTRSKRPAWVKRFFGSPVDYLIANAGCPVVEA
jgi:nucleotide-binding universal stress UspA family protein